MELTCCSIGREVDDGCRSTMALLGSEESRERREIWRGRGCALSFEDQRWPVKTAELQFRAGLPLFWWRFSSSDSADAAPHADRGDVQTDTLTTPGRKNLPTIIHKTFSFSAQIPLCDQ